MEKDVSDEVVALKRLIKAKTLFSKCYAVLAGFVLVGIKLEYLEKIFLKGLAIPIAYFCLGLVSAALSVINAL